MSMPFNDFAEIDPFVLMFGETIEATTLSQVNKNSQEAWLTPEFFEPANFANGDTIPLPVSDIDGYEYARDELFYVSEWRAQNADSTGQHFRLPAFRASISTLGVVSITVWRLKPGGPYITEPDAGDADLTIRVLVIGIRGKQGAIITGSEANPPTDIGTETSDKDGDSDTINGV